MLSKCANPACSVPFLYLHQGKLFRRERGAGGENEALPGEDLAFKKPPRRVEFFWLCDSCAAEMTLGFEKGIGVTTVPLVRARKAASASGHR